MQSDNRKAFEDELLGFGVDASVGQGELRALGDMYRALRRSWKLILLAGVFGAVAAYALSYTKEVRYTSVAQVMIETRTAQDTEFTPFISDLPTSLTALQSELEVLRSLDLVERVADKLDLYNDPEFFDPETEDVVATESVDDAEARQAAVELQRETTITNIAKRIEIAQVGEVSAVYAIRFTSADQRKASVLANALAEEYVNTTRLAKLRSLELSQTWLSQRVEQLQQKLSDLGVVLERHLLGAPYSPDEIETIKARNVAAERRQSQLDQQGRLLDDSISRVKGLLERDRPLLAALVITEPTPELTAAIAAQRAEQDGAEQALIDEVNRSLDRMAARRAELDLELQPLTAELDQTRAVLIEQARRDAEAKRIENDIAVSEAIYQDFMTQLSRRTEQSEYLDADARIIAMARPPILPSEPLRKLYAVGGLIGGLVLMMVFTVIQELLQRRMRNVREFEAGTGLPLLGVVPEAPPRHAPFITFLDKDGAIAPELMRFVRKLRWSILAELPGDRANTRMPASGIADEAASRRRGRGKAANLRGGFEGGSSGASGAYGGAPEPSHTVIAGASANRGDGQSSSMLALACSFADGGEKVLLIDCDFGQSPFAQMLSETDANLEYIRFDPRKAKQFIVETAYENLDVLPAPKAAVEATQKIGAAEWWRLFRHLSTQYDRILLDTPPLMSGIDTAVLQQVADVVLLFARWNSTTRGETRSMIKVLGDVGVTPLAVVATRIELDKVRSYGDDALFYLGKSMTA